MIRVGATADDGKRRVNHLEGPQGFTQGFDDETIDILERMGMIERVQTTSTAEWETTFYRAVGMPAKPEVR